MKRIKIVATPPKALEAPQFPMSPDFSVSPEFSLSPDFSGNGMQACIWQLLVTIAVWILYFDWATQPSWAQQPPASDTDILSEELLKDIVPKDAAESLDSQEAKGGKALDGKRSFGAGENPFEIISLGMLTASKYLREGEIGSTTQDVQSNVLMRLDELIEQSEKQGQKPKPSQSSSSQRSMKRQVTPKQRSQQREQQRSSQPNSSEGGQDSDEEEGGSPRRNDNADDRESDAGRPNATGSQTADGGRITKADLGDAKALQQGVWGHLPERIRQQMMSRMVERFLPEYEASIEEYFRKLSDSQQDSKKP